VGEKGVSSAVVIVIVIVIAIAGVGSYLLLKGGEGEGDAYELSYSFQPGESYVYDQRMEFEFPEDLGIPPVEVSSIVTQDVLEVVDNEFEIRSLMTMQTTISGEAPQTGTVAMTYRMTNKGVRYGLEIENVEPPGLWASMEQMREQQESYLETINQYPTDPVPVGRKWSIPIDFQFEQAGIPMTLVGEARSSIAGRENMTVGAGTFDCWRLVHKMSVTGEAEVMGQKITVTMSVDGTSWIDLQSGAQTKVNLPMSFKVKVAGEEVKLSINITIELIEYQAP